MMMVVRNVLILRKCRLKSVGMSFVNYMYTHIHTYKEREERNGTS